MRGAWRTLYRFDLQEQVLPDYELTSWYLSNHPESHFVRRLIAARTGPQCRYALLDNELAVHELGGETVRRKLSSAGELREVLSETFGIAVPEGPEVDKKLTRSRSRAEARPTAHYHAVGRASARLRSELLQSPL